MRAVNGRAMEVAVALGDARCGASVRGGCSDVKRALDRWIAAKWPGEVPRQLGMPRRREVQK
jgi:hypothetical protein